MEAIVLSETRVAILALLAKDKEKIYTNNDIVKYAGVSKGQVSHIMKMLAMDGLVERYEELRMENHLPYKIWLYKYKPIAENLVIIDQGTTHIRCGTKLRIVKF